MNTSAFVQPEQAEKIRKILNKYLKFQTKIVTLAESHIWTVLSKEDVANIVELGLKQTSVMRREWPSEVVTESRVSIFHIKTCQKKTAISTKLRLKKVVKKKSYITLLIPPSFHAPH